MKERHEEDIDALERQNGVLVESMRSLATASATKRENSVINDMTADIASMATQIAALETRCTQASLATSALTVFAKRQEGIVEAAQQAGECVICLEELRTTALIPCGHRAVCDTCAGDMKKCPLCRRDVTSTLRVFG